jgi:hypothetical protein
MYRNAGRRRRGGRGHGARDLGRHAARREQEPERHPADGPSGPHRGGADGFTELSRGGEWDEAGSSSLGFPSVRERGPTPQ